jgi:hypothetical protein
MPVIQQGGYPTAILPLGNFDTLFDQCFDPEMLDMFPINGALGVEQFQLSPPSFGLVPGMETGVEDPINSRSLWEPHVDSTVPRSL